VAVRGQVGPLRLPLALGRFDPALHDLFELGQPVGSELDDLDEAHWVSSISGRSILQASPRPVDERRVGVGLEAGDHLDAALAAAKTGDGDGLVTLYRWVHPDLVRYLTSRAGGDGEDLAADVWMEVARVLPRFEGGPHDLRRFIFSTAHRRSVDRFRRLGRRRTDPTELGLLVQVCGPDETERSVMAGLEGDDAARLITRLLPPNQAEVILLRV